MGIDLIRKDDCGYRNGNRSDLEEDPAMELTRKALAGSIMIIIAIFVAVSLVRSGDESDLYWVTQKRIAIGDRIESGDVALARLDLPGLESLYLSSQEEIVGKFATEPMMTGEAVARSEVTEQSDNALWRLVSLDLARNDIPISVTSGSVIDIYRVFDPSQSIDRGDQLADLVITSLVVDGIVPGGSLSDRTQVILRVRLPEVRPLLDAYSSGSLLLVGHVA